MSTRKQCRKALAALFADQGFTAVHDYAPTNLNGASKVLCIYSDETEHDFISEDLDHDLYDFFLEVYVKRSGASAEDDLDDLHEVIRSICRANVGTATWDHLHLNRKSTPLFAEVAGVPYRVERHIVGITTKP